ncbi:SMI1/KNR4 family protein [Flagellimonas sp.]|uniref:SMI1/KNR4 family protein n=1 Tax=Flagellimonas sp. TaxID=2058762 RepID=UPI003BA93A40
MRILLLIALLCIASPVKAQVGVPMVNYWNTYKEHLREKLPLYYSRLNTPATAAEIGELESFIKTELPKDFKTLYGINNGEDESWYVGGVLCGMRMLTISQITNTLQELKEIEDEYDFNSEWIGEIIPEGTIKPGHFYNKWIPVFSDDNGNYIGLDLTPDLNGKYGQIINFGAEEYDHFVMANTLAEFIEIINSFFENGKADQAIYENEKGERVMFGLVKDSHLTDDLKRMMK